MSGPIRIDRRTTIKWMLAATAALPAMQGSAFAAAPLPPAKGYGTDPDLLRIYAPGDLWPLSFTDDERRTATALCDVIIPADAGSPSASAVGVVDFLDEWISAPYVPQQQDRKLILAGLELARGRSRAPVRTRFRRMQRIAAVCDLRCNLLLAEGRASTCRGRPILRPIPRPDGRRVLHDARRNAGHRVRRECRTRAVRRAAAGSPRTGGAPGEGNMTESGRRLGVGLIGSGFNAGFHLRAFRAVRDADVLGIWSPTARNAAAAAEQARRLDVGESTALLPAFAKWSPIPRSTRSG